jgi:hypothetical protein
MTAKPIEDQQYTDSVLEKYPFTIEHGKIEDGRYSVKCGYLGEVRFGPPYFAVNVFKDNEKIWGDSTYGGELFCENIISEKYNKLILVKWFSLSDPNDQIVTEIDLETAKEKQITEKGRYFYAGHFNSFDGIFYHKRGVQDTICIDFESQETFLLQETLKHDIEHVLSWGLSPIENTIIVISNTKKENIILYDLKNKKILKRITVHYKLSENGKIRCYLDKKNESVLIQFSDYDVLVDGKISNERKEYKLLEF